MTHPQISPTLDAVVAGYLGVDIAPGFPSVRTSIPIAELFRPGKMIETKGLSISLGGVVANTGLAMKQFGQRVALMGCVGTDALGDIALSLLHEKGMSDGIQRNDKAGTAYGIVVAPPGVDRIFFEDPGCNEVFTADHIDYPTVARSRLFHFGYPSVMEKLWAGDGAELQKMFKRVRELGVTTSLDMALPDPTSLAARADWRKILSATLPNVDIFVPSIEEILLMLEPERYARILAAAGGCDLVDAIPQEEYERLAETLLGMGVKVLMIKAGYRGAYLRTADASTSNGPALLNLPEGKWSRRKLWIDSFPADARRIKNACGAGDCAVAAFLTALQKGVEIEKAAQYAMLAGRDNLYGIDAVSGLSDWETMTGIIDR